MQFGEICTSNLVITQAKQVQSPITSKLLPNRTRMYVILLQTIIMEIIVLLSIGINVVYELLIHLPCDYRYGTVALYFIYVGYLP